MVKLKQFVVNSRVYCLTILSVFDHFLGLAFNELSRGIAGKIHRKYLCRKSENYYLAKRSFVILSLMVALFLASFNLPSSRVVQSPLILLWKSYANRFTKAIQDLDIQQKYKLHAISLYTVLFTGEKNVPMEYK